MTTIAVVRKYGYATIAVGTLTKWGSGKESAAYDRPGLSAEQIARLAIEAAAEFDDSAGLPDVSHDVKLRIPARGTR